MSDENIGDISIDITNLRNAQVQTTHGETIELVCVTGKESDIYKVRVTATCGKTVVGAVTLIDKDSSIEMSICVDKNESDISPILPKPQVINFNETGNFGLTIKDKSESEELKVHVNSSYIGRVVIENSANISISSLTLLGDRVSGFVALNCCDDIKLQLLVINMSVFLVREILRDSREGVVGKLRESEYTIGLITPSKESKSSTISILLKRAAGNRDMED